MRFMFGRPTLKDLFAEMREESQRREEESKRRDVKYRTEFERRGAEFRAEFERRDARFQAESKRRDEEFKVEAKRRDEGFREFNREILLRNEKVYTSVLARLEELGEEIRSSTARIDSNTEETRAQTQALLRWIDRMDESGGAAAA